MKHKYKVTKSIGIRVKLKKTQIGTNPSFACSFYYNWHHNNIFLLFRVKLKKKHFSGNPKYGLHFGRQPIIILLLIFFSIDWNSIFRKDHKECIFEFEGSLGKITVTLHECKRIVHINNNNMTIWELYIWAEIQKSFMLFANYVLLWQYAHRLFIHS